MKVVDTRVATKTRENKSMKPAVVNSPSDTQVEVVRGFDAPVDSVWKPFTDADLVRQWMLGPPGWSMPICEMDFRVGGKYENVFRNEADGLEISIAGDFRQIETHRKIVQDEKHLIGDSDDDTNQETVVTITFQEMDRRTTVTTVIEYASTKARDEALATGMGAAMEMGYCRIDELLVG
ncbi:SRPBCC domain-containing protein [Stratiformator vulcanicus]|uniref:Activator of Hsp90 ATPase homologue 1/2-like C-terminal domain-containing protein n=1 Tax=Stratiformator vulcanicus TaxID=2527980 RepID=A0A517QVT5_9PLAN|nr:SRPBCC domain-containing protein [Stratiformator vulcanicus]QDT35728.1 hypothetical protein Pan189_00810 [Stratiformator vulcanicus]